MTTKRPTQSDVARLAGVSRGTVSMVLNNQTDGRVPISENTRDRVLHAARELGYAPNPVAQMLAQGSNRLIGVFTYEPVFPYDKGNFYFPYLQGIESEASREDFNVLLFTRYRNSTPPRIYQNEMNSLRLADGSILLGSQPDRDELRRLVAEDYPFVFIGRRDIPGCDISWVANDYRMGSAEALTHLITLGHKHIGFVSNGIHLEPQQDKLAGCDEALRHAPDVQFVVLPDSIEKYPEELLTHIQENGLTALVCDSDTTFDDSLRILHEAGVSVPGEISALCLTTPHNDHPLTMQPTYVKLNRDRLGMTAVQILNRRITGEAQMVEHIHIPCALVVGETTAPPNSIQ